MAETYFIVGGLYALAIGLSYGFYELIQALNRIQLTLSMLPRFLNTHSEVPITSTAPQPGDIRFHIPNSLKSSFEF